MVRSPLSPSLSLSPPYVGGKRLASSMLRRVHRREEKRVERGGDLSGREAQRLKTPPRNSQGKSQEKPRKPHNTKDITTCVKNAPVRKMASTPRGRMLNKKPGAASASHAGSPVPRCRTRRARRRIGHLRNTRTEDSSHSARRRTGARCRTRYARRRIGRLHRRRTRHARRRNGHLRESRTKGSVYTARRRLEPDAGPGTYVDELGTCMVQGPART